MSLKIFIFLIAIAAVEIPELRNSCIACTGFGNWFCADDPNLVNLNSEKCYTSAGDKTQYCRTFNFFDNSMLCDTVNMTMSKACD